MGETLNLLFRSREQNTFEVQVKESWSGRTVTGSFVPPYTSKQLNALHKKLNDTESNADLQVIGMRLFQALCGTETPAPGPGSNSIGRREMAEQPVQAMLRGVIQRTLRRRGTVAMTMSFGPGCDEFVRFPWELLYNGEYFLIASGIFTLTRAIIRPEPTNRGELPMLPVHLPMRLLYISASPSDFPSIETERSYEALERVLEPYRDKRQIIIDKLPQATYDDLVGYLSSLGGVDAFDDASTSIPCYAVHFDGHGAYGRLCPEEECDQMNAVEAKKCSECGASLARVKPQTYLCFCNEEGKNSYIDTETLRELFVGSDIRLAVFSACDTATLTCDITGHGRKIALDATLATALVMSQIPAVVAMPFSLQDDLSPTFMLHFYEALAQGRTLEEALSRTRHAMLPKHHGWFVPVMYRQVSEGQAGPVPLIAVRDVPDEHDHPLAHLVGAESFVGREQELGDLSALLSAAARGEEQHMNATGHYTLKPGTHHIVLTGPVGIGKSALAIEVAKRNREMFPGAFIAISLQGGKHFSEALLEMAHYLHIPLNTIRPNDLSHHEEQILNALRSRASRALPCLILLESFEEVKEHMQSALWDRFLSALPEEVVVIATSRSNPGAVIAAEGRQYRWYEYAVGKMTDADLLKLFDELASFTGLDQRIHLASPHQQAVLREICTLLDGYPLGAELIFGTSRSIEGKLYTPEAATRSLEEVRDELRESPLAGINAVLDVAYRRLSLPARLLLSYLAAFKLPFSHEQILMLVSSEKLASANDVVRLERPVSLQHEAPDTPTIIGEGLHIGDAVPAELTQHWSSARDELVDSSFMQFDGRVYTIHPQVRNFAFLHLPIEERRRIHRVVADYYLSHPQPSPEEWFAAYEHLQSAGDPQDLQRAIDVAVKASWAMCGRGHVFTLMNMLRRAEAHASRLGDKSGEGKLQCCLGAILRLLGNYAEAVGCLTRSLDLHREQHERKEMGWALYELAMLSREEGHFKQAGAYAQEAMHIFREIDDARSEAWMQVVTAEVSRGCGAYYDASGHLEDALKSFQKYNDTEGYASALRDRGTVYEALGKYHKALADYEEALRLFNQLGLRGGQAWVMADQSIVLMDQGKYEKAAQLCGEAIPLFREQGIRRGEGWALRAMGDIARKRRNYSDARGYYEEAQSIFNALGDRVDDARVLNSLGAISFDEGEQVEAKEYYEQALAIAQEQGARQIEGRAMRGLGDIFRVLRRFADAERCYRDAITIAVELDTPAEHCAALRRQGYLKEAQGRYADTLSCWVQALALDMRLGHESRAYLQALVDRLVAEHSLQDEYAELCKEHGLA
jgi:tetratricopeptide (TPR) repeat protein